MNAAPFGLYLASGLGASQRVAAGRRIDLDTPVVEAGVTLFRASCWLPMPPGVAGALALRLAASTLQVRFDALRFEVGTGNRAWFPSVRKLDANRVRIEFTWPATVVRVRSPSSGVRHAIDLLRADGDAVAAEATVSGQTGADLPAPWVGSPLVVLIGDPIASFARRDDEVAQIGGDIAHVARASGPAVGTGPVVAGPSLPIAALLGLADVPALTLSGQPTSPRLKLFAEQPGGVSTLLWQGMLPGPQGTVTLPAQSVDIEWAGALSQLLKLSAQAETAPTLLRLDLESDAPCSATFSQLALAIEVETELLGQPWRASFGGGQPERQALTLAVPAGASGESIVLQGRVVADNDGSADGGASAGAARHGALLAADDAALQPMALTQPMSVAGLALHWQPLSDQVQLRLRLLADGGAGPAALVLAQSELSVDTPRETWLAPRWPAVDLQARVLWVELTVVAGTGLWLFGSAGGGSATGWIESRGSRVVRTLLPQSLALATIGPAALAQASRPITVTLGDQTLAATLPAGALSLAVPKALLTLLASQPVVFTGGVRGSITVESARLVMRSNG